MNLDVLDGLYEPIQSLVRVIQECLAGDDQLPLAVPYRTTNQAIVGIVVW